MQGDEDDPAVRRRGGEGEAGSEKETNREKMLSERNTRTHTQATIPRHTLTHIRHTRTLSKEERRLKKEKNDRGERER